MYDIVGKRRWYYLFSALITVPGLIFIALGGLKPSIDFTGGTVWQVRFTDDPSPAEVQAALVALDHPEAVVETVDGGFLEIRLEPIEFPIVGGIPTPAPTSSPSLTPSPTGSPVDTPAPSGSVSESPSATPSPIPTPSPTPSPTPTPEPTPPPPPTIEGTPIEELVQGLEAQFGFSETRSLDTVGAIIGSELIRSSIIILAVGEAFILLYLWYRFRSIRFGTAAIVALVHDVIVVVGAFAILGYFFGVEFDALFVTALLTVIGFSVHDSIVVFDRIRENRLRHAGESFGAIVNHSILQTMGRSINTSLTVIATTAALLLLGPVTIQTFTLALLIGIVSGTYSSIFNASQILVTWDEWAAKRKARRSAR
ncbi:MAG TPA: protein translocase subunit SecF [Candidatus Limnocylindria bacterium]|nr:protein translocase subunit SecF [Candidatus Limnocylindria bacterium]